MHRILLELSIPLFSLLLFLLQTAEVDSSFRAAVLHSGYQYHANDIKDKIIKTGLYSNGSVDTINIGSVAGPGNTPTASWLLANYQSLIIFQNSQPVNSSELGDVLADYIDQGGGIVSCGDDLG